LRYVKIKKADKAEILTVRKAKKAESYIALICLIDLYVRNPCDETNKPFILYFTLLFGV